LKTTAAMVKWLALAFAVTVLGMAIWSSDKISYEGERTIYSVRCEQGVWEGWRCTGRLAAADRYRFRASKSRQEVLYWVVGSSAASGKYTNCKVVDRGNWTCALPVGQLPTITHEMAQGRPMPDEGAGMLPFRAVSKVQWWLLDIGLHVTKYAVQ
jgi:hypothetical protein